jgi:hypothetical protein
MRTWPAIAMIICLDLPSASRMLSFKKTFAEFIRPLISMKKGIRFAPNKFRGRTLLLFVASQPVIRPVHIASV